MATTVLADGPTPLLIYPRSTWTDEPHGWTWQGALDPADVEYLFIHWPGDGAPTRAGYTAEQVAARWRAYRAYHTAAPPAGHGWSDIGYCYGIDLAGRIWELGGEYVAAHTAGHNKVGVGVLLLLGTEDEPSPEMVAAVVALRTHLEGKYPHLAYVLGHTQVPGASTTCPGAHALAAVNAGAFGPVGAPTEGSTPVSKIVNPFVGRVTSEFGGARQHYGIDIAPPQPGQTGLPVYAAYAGTVEKVRRNPAEPALASNRTGNGLIVRNDDGERQLYNHVAPAVRVGQRVTAGQVVGHNDRSGNQTGPHLHFEVWGANGVPRDPRVDFTASGVAPGVGKPAAPSPQKGRNFLPLADDGDFGHRSITELERALKATGDYEGVIEEDLGRTAEFGPMLAEAFQRYLARHHFLDATRWALDGKFLAESIKALQRYLKALDLYPYGVDGLAPNGGDTWKGLQRALNNRQVKNGVVFGKEGQPAPAPAPKPTPAPAPAPEPAPQPAPAPAPTPAPAPADDALRAALRAALAGARITITITFPEA